MDSVSKAWATHHARIEGRILCIDNALNDVKYELWPEIVQEDEFKQLVDEVIRELEGLKQDYDAEYL